MMSRRMASLPMNSSAPRPSSSPNLVYARDNQANLARAFGSALTTGMTVADVLEWPDRIEAVKVEDVKAAAAKVLDIRRSVTGILQPASGSSLGGGQPIPSSPSNSSQQ